MKPLGDYSFFVEAKVFTGTGGIVTGCIDVLSPDLQSSF
jgi:hypothetical protein